MLDPAAARNTFADDLVAEYQRLELILLELIADKIARGLDAPDWAARQVMELQRFRKEAGVIAAKMAGKSPELIASAIQRAVTDGFLAASQDIAVAEGISAGQVVANAGTVPAIDGPAIAALLAETTGALTAVDQGVLRVTDDIYRRVVARGAATVVSGAETRKQATQRALTEFTRNGITGFLDRRGKSWSLTAYTEMAIRTGTTKALMQSHSNRLTERGYDLVIVSSHPRPAPQCQPYERQILSLSGRTLGVISETSRTTGRTVSVKVKASLAEAESRGLHHPNAILGGDQGIDTMGRIFNGVRAWYSGPSVNVACASGVRFTVSPNHPVLTSLGWMPAKALDVGHHLFRTTGADLGSGTTVAGEYLHDMPPLVEEVFDALTATGSSSRIPAAANDLHDDGRFCQGEIDVVVADDRLLLVGDANGVQCGGESHLIGADVEMPGRPSAGALGLHSDTVSGSIRGALPHIDSDFMQSAEDRAVADSEDVGEVLRGLPRLVETDQIIDVERDAFYEGHAYDFQTGTGAYALNSLIVHNCRHRHSLFVPGVTDTSPTKADDAGYEDTQKLRYMERQTREWKRRAATSLDPAEKKAANAKVREWQGKIKAHTETTGVGRRRDREQLDLGNKTPTLDPAKVPTPKKPIPKANLTPASPTRPKLEVAPTPKPVAEVPKLNHPVPDDMPSLSKVFDLSPGKRISEMRKLDGVYGRGLQFKWTHLTQGVDKFIAAGKVYDTRGNEVGDVERYFKRTKSGMMTVKNEYLYLEPRARGRGFARDFYATLETWYTDSGVDRILVDASLEDGGYAWAKAGFQWDAKLFDESTVLDRAQGMLKGVKWLPSIGEDERRILAATVERMENYKPNDRRFPTPQELVNLGADGKLGEQLMRGSSWSGVKKLKKRS